MRMRTECATWLRKLIYPAIFAAAPFVVASLPAAAKNPATEQEPVYNPATTIDFFATLDPHYSETGEGPRSPASPRCFFFRLPSIRR